MVLSVSKKQVLISSLVTVGLLLIPLTAMLFTQEVNWTPFDFLVGGVLLFSVGMAMSVVSNGVKNKSSRYLIFALMILAFALIWAELAVGIFN